MDVKVNIERYDPDAEAPASYWQEYSLAIPESATVLDALIQIREEMDGTLSLRCSCRSAICGSCAMRVNGHAVLACKSRASESLNAEGVMTVEPAGVMPVMKDLVVDFDPFWDKIRAVEPYLQPQGPRACRRVHRLQRIDAPPLRRDRLHHVRGLRPLIAQFLEVDPTFLGPAALAKAYRFTADPRDGDADGVSQRRLELLSLPTGMWGLHPMQ